MGDNNSEESIQPIPQVPKHWFLGNLPDIDASFFAKSYWELAELYGPIFQLDMGGQEVVVVSNYELLKDVMDDDRFEKYPSIQAVELRALVGDGLFTAYNEEPNWAKAHRILMPVFGPLGVKKMFNQQMDIASQMILRWDRYGPKNEILCSDDFTRLAFDTIGLCAFNFRFNEFYTDNIHPFAKQMADSMIEAGKRAGRTRLETMIRFQEEKKYWNDIAAQHELCEDIIDERIKDPKPEINDLLNIMLHQRDPVTGETLDHLNIRNQMATFLIAGHETTSGTLSFLFYNLLKNPETYHKAQQEVDEVVGTNALTVEHLPKLKYVEACIKETLRYCGPIVINSRRPKQPQIIGGPNGRYKVYPNQMVQLNLKSIHHDRQSFGEDADEFKPERLLDFDKIPDGAWKPFGIGIRACIGRAFAEQEMIINATLILQRFQVEMADPSYKLEYLSTLTIKPKEFKIKVRRRPGRSINVGLSAGGFDHEVQKPTENGEAKKSLLILYGSNAGTCQAYAEELASRAGQYGYHADVKTMDSGVERLPKDRPVGIITPSYEGKPPDNAKKFCAWLEANKTTMTMSGVKFFLFGVGNQEWVHTFHKVPKRVDQLMELMGGERIVETGFVNVQGDTMGPFEDWCDRVKQVLGENSRTEPEKGLQATMSKAHTAETLAGFKDTIGIVKKNVEIADNSVGPRKMHMEIELPASMTYETGDYIAVLPVNHRDNVKRILTKFNLNPDDAITITATRKEFLKSATPFSVYDLLASRVELSTPITQRQLKALASATKDSKEKEEIENMAGDQWDDTLKKRFSIIDVLEDHPSCTIEFTKYVDMLKAMTARQYSISSTMLDQRVETHEQKKAIASIMYDVYESNAFCGKGRTFHGVASTHLADAKLGSPIRCTVRQTNAGFHLPKDVTQPIIMICSGTGLAPMRGFIEERAAIQKARETKLGPALLYFGCRDVNKDYIYKDQLQEWEKQGVVSLRPCFSKHGTVTDKYKYTSDRIYAEKEECSKLFSEGGKVFLCGSASKIGKSTADVCMKIHMEANPGCTQEQAEKWLDEIKENRYVSDVFG